MAKICEADIIHIATVGFHSKHIYSPLKEYGGKKLILLTSGGRRKKDEERMAEAVAEAKRIVKLLNIELEIIELKGGYDYTAKFNEIAKIIRKEKNVVVNVTGGPKFDSFVLYMAALKYNSNVKAVLYIREDIHEIVKLPKLIISEIKLTEFEQIMLKAIKPGISAKELAKQLNKPFSQVLRYSRILEKKGLIRAEKDGQTRYIYPMQPYI